MGLNKGTILSITTQTKAANRFESIDSFRGIAALLVVLYHLSGSLEKQLDPLLFDWLNTFMDFGFVGVPIFFVISGFAIAYSLKNIRMTSRNLGVFFLRRSIRLDFTYWVCIALSILLMVAKNLVTGESEALPSVSDVLFHMFYVQDLAQIDYSISVVYWTLCLEIQFYLFFVVCLAACRAISITHNTELMVLLLLITGFWSLLVDYKFIDNLLPGLFVPFWHYFVFGVLFANIVLNRPLAKLMFILWSTIECVFLLFIHVKYFAVAGTGFALALYVLWYCNALQTIHSKSLAYLAAISYPLYLLHPDFGWKTIAVLERLLPIKNSALLTLMIFAMGIVASIISAHVVHKFIEAPSQRLSKKFSMQKAF